MKKLILIFLILTLVGITALFAAGSKDNQSAKPKELTLWHTSFVDEWSGRKAVVDYFEAHNTLPVSKDYGPALYRDVSQKFIIQARTGSPDVLEGVLEQLYSYARAGLLLPLDDYFDKDPDSSNYGKNVINALRYQGKLYGVPYNTNVRLLLYRKSIFQQLNLKPPANWKELLDTAVYIHQQLPDIQGFMFTTKTREVRAFQEFMSFYLQLNKHMFLVKGDSTEYVGKKNDLEQVLYLYHNMFFNNAIDLDERGGDWKALDYGYTSGKFAMVSVGPWIWSHRYEDPARGKVLDDTAIVALPVAANGTPGTYMEVKPIMINAYTKQPDKAYQLLKEVTSKDFQLLLDTKTGVIPGRTDAIADPRIQDNPWLGSFAKYADTGVALDPVSWEQAQNAIIEAIQKTIYNQAPVSDVASWLDEQLRTIAKGL